MKKINAGWPVLWPFWGRWPKREEELEETNDNKQIEDPQRELSMQDSESTESKETP